MERLKLLGRFLVRRLKSLTQQQFIVIMALVTGLLSGLAAVMLKNAVHYTNEYLMHRAPREEGSILFFALPMIGIILAVLFVRYVVRDNISHGISRILYAISRKNSELKPHNTYSSLVGSTLTIGFGGSVGAEAPIVLTGAAIGSNLGRLMRLNYRELTLLIGCGAAGAVAGIFKAPIAGLVFTLEVLMLDLTMASIVPLLVSAVTAATVATLLLGAGAVFVYTGSEGLVFSDIPFYILLGVLAAFVSYYFTEVTYKVEKWFSGIRDQWTRMALGGVTIGLLIFFFPPLFGEGYSSLQLILSGHGNTLVEKSYFYGLGKEQVLLMFLLLVLLFKAWATAFTNASGGIGGVFAPSLFLGGITGFALALAINTYTPWTVSEASFCLIGMAGVMSGVMHAPLTAIFLIAELTGGYGLFIPLIITSAIAYQTIKYFEPNSLYTKRLAISGELFTHDRDRNVLNLMNVRSLIETDFVPVMLGQSLGDLVAVIEKSPRNVFPVIDETGKLHGVIIMDDIRGIMFHPEQYSSTSVNDLMFMPPVLVHPDDDMELVVNKFRDADRFNMVVVENGKYLGFVSKARIFSAYRRLLKEFSQEG
jgi:chloride channel protein, CIC family